MPVSLQAHLKSSFIIACQGLTLFGLLGQLRIPDPPSYSSVSTNLLDPWKTWCLNDFSCFGTSWAHWGGPYSIMWYWINALITLNGLLPYTPVLFAINLVIQRRLGLSWTGLLFGFNCIWGVLGWPQNMIVFWLLFLGFRNKWGLVLAPLFKLPIGAPLYIWQIAFDSHTAVRDPGNWFSYLWLGILWTTGFVLVRRRGKAGNRLAD